MLKKIGHGFIALSFLVATSVPVGAAPYIPGKPGAADAGVAHKGLTAGFRFSMPFGAVNERADDPSLKLAVDMYKRSSATGSFMDLRSHRASLAALDFSGQGFDRMTIANRTAISTTRDPVNGDRLNFAPTPSSLLWGAIVIGTAVGVYLLVDDGGGGNGEQQQTIQ